MKSMDPCPSCVDGVLTTYCSRRLDDGTHSVRYLSCDAGCGYTGNEIVTSPRRRPKKRTTSSTQIVHAPALNSESVVK